MAVAEGARTSAPPGPALPPPTVLSALSAAAGLDLGAFRAPHVARTVERAVARLGLRDAAALADALDADADLQARFRRAVAVSTTGMFRDPEQFELLDRLLDDGPGPRPLRVWSVGASDGSELCSLGLLLRRRGVLPGSQLLGSDLLPENVALARTRSAERVDGGVLRAMRFEQRDVAVSAPPGTWDVVLCRNVLIHLSPGARGAMLDHVTGGLAPGGVLLLGRAERLPRGAEHGLRDVGPNAYRRAA
jgi:chemotaxis methyl-accepting protein methylase